MGLNIVDTSFSKSASPVDHYVQKLNTVCGDGPCEVFSPVAGVKSVEESLYRDYLEPDHTHVVDTTLPEEVSLHGVHEDVGIGGGHLGAHCRSQ